MKHEKQSRQGLLATAIIISVLVIDQIIKILVKTNMSIGEQIHITDWFYILFVENNGMAFGMEIFSKLFLSIFRILAIGFFIWYLCKIINKGLPKGYIITIAFVIAGATGNLIDCLFYGQIFSASSIGAEGVAHFTPFGEGYAPMLYGKVVDMFYFPLWTWPDWLPLIGGNIFFSPIFNFADSCITCGIIVLILFYSRYVNMGLNLEGEHTDADEKDTDN